MHHRIIKEFLFIIVFGFVGTLGDIRNDIEISNSVPGDIAGLPGTEGRETCEKLAAAVNRADVSTESEIPLRLSGKWVSEGCEIRSGPEYILRSYSFSRNHTFKLLQYHYADASCTSPQFVVTAKGRLKVRGRSWVTPGAMETEYWLEKVSVYGHKSRVVEDLSRKVNTSCPGLVRRRWRPFREYLILNFNPSVDDNDYITENVANKAESKSTSSRYSHPSREELDCADLVLPAAFHELQLLRIQNRPGGSPDYRQPRVELLLGDIHSRPELRLSYRPTAYQVPLLRADQLNGCSICRMVARSSEKSPPHLPAKPHLPVFLSGNWISVRCEVRPLGMFLKRTIAFKNGKKWSGKFSYYSDPACSLPTITTIANGRYSNGRESPRVQGGTESEFRIDTVSMAIHDRSIVSALNSINHSNNCGSNSQWLLDDFKDVTHTGGCKPLGILVPTIERELLKIEMDPNGNSLLFIGQVDTERGNGFDNVGNIIRPTAYQVPLIQCKSVGNLFTTKSQQHRYFDSNIESNMLPIIPHARIALLDSNAATKRAVSHLVIFCSVLLAYLHLM